MKRPVTAFFPSLAVGVPKIIYAFLILNGKYRNPDDSGLLIGPIFKGRIPTFRYKLSLPSSRVKNPDVSGNDPTFRDKLSFPSSRVKNPDVSGDKLSVPFSGVKNPDASRKPIRPIFNSQDSRRFETAYHRSHLQGSRISTFRDNLSVPPSRVRIQIPVP